MIEDLQADNTQQSFKPYKLPNDNASEMGNTYSNMPMTILVENENDSVASMNFTGQFQAHDPNAKNITFGGQANMKSLFEANNSNAFSLGGPKR